MDIRGLKAELMKLDDIVYEDVKDEEVREKIRNKLDDIGSCVDDLKVDINSLIGMN